MMTAEDCLKQAFQALLRGDTAERDRLCRLAEHIRAQQIRVQEGGQLMPGEPIELVRQPDGNYISKNLLK